jgi:hypothetical protein
VIVFAHIPKTAGTSLAHSFEASCFRRVLFDYTPNYDNVVMKPNEEAFFSRHREFIVDRFDYIYGHFYISKYKKIFPDARYVTCFRNPVDRILSQYRHLYAYRGHSKNDYADLIMAGKMNVVEFASQPNVHNAQTVHLDGYSLRDLDFFFLAEWLVDSVHAFNELFGRHLPIPGKLNVAERKAKRLRIRRSEKDEVARIAGADMELYMEAVAFFLEERRTGWKRLRSALTGSHSDDGSPRLRWSSPTQLHTTPRQDGR